MFALGQTNDEGDIYDFFIQHGFLVPMVCGDTVTMVGSEDDNCVFPKILPFYFDNNFPNFSIHGFYKTVVSVEISSPVIGCLVSCGIKTIAEASFISQYIGIVGGNVEVGRQVGAIF